MTQHLSYLFDINRHVFHANCSMYQFLLKTYDSAVGDITILANRSDRVDFSAPYDESGLTVIVTVKDDKSWIFLTPFPKEMWELSFALLIYTVLVVWLLERQTNPEFQGPWHDQLSLAIWFTFSIIFFTQSKFFKF